MPTTLAEGVASPSGASGAPDHGHRHLGLALAVISMAQLMVVLDATIVNIALPHIKTDLGFSDASLSWVVNGYTLVFGSLLLLGGRAGDLLGRRKVFISGVVLFAFASFLGGIAQSESQMLGARVLQGVGAAIASPTALSLITTTFPAGPARNRAMAVYAAMSGAGAAIGLILGGALTEISWRWTFFINVPMALIVLVLAPRVLGESRRQSGRFDLPGALTGTAGLVALVYGLTHAAPDRWGDASTIAYLVAGVVLLVAFVLVESRSSHALMPMRILADRNRGGSYVVMLMVGAALFAMFFFLSIFIQSVLGYSSLRAGVAFLPFSVGIVTAAQVASQLVNRVDPRWVAGFGILMASSGLLWLSRLTETSTYVGGLLGPIVILSLGLGLTFVPMTLTAVSGVRTEDSGIASAVLNTMQQIGGALGLAVLATVSTTAATNHGTSAAAALREKVASGALSPEQAKALSGAISQEAMVHGFTRAFLVGAVMVAVAAVVAVSAITLKHHELAESGSGAVHLG